MDEISTAAQLKSVTLRIYIRRRGFRARGGGNFAPSDFAGIQKRSKTARDNDITVGPPDFLTFQCLWTNVGSAEAVSAFGGKRPHCARALVAGEPNRQATLCDQPRAALLRCSMYLGWPHCATPLYRGGAR